MSGIEKGNYPTHIAIILDGNRRYAKRLNLDPKKGHEFGFKKLRPLFDWCKELDIHELTLYCFSIENFNRSKDEVDYLMSEFVKKFDELNGDKTLEEDDVKINVVGRIHLFPKEVQKRLHEIIEKTKNHKTFIINFAMAYGGRSEVVDATKKIAQQVKEGTLKIENIDDEVIAKNLYFSSQPDLIIRPGGEIRTSNFLIYQGAYAEWFFLQKTWPEFEKQDLINIIEEFRTRERRFGA